MVRLTLLYSRAAWLALALAVTACGGSDDNSTPPPAPDTGPVTREEFLALNNPTYPQFITAYEETVAANPGVEADEVKLRQELYSRLKAVVGASANAPSSHRMLPQALSDDALSALGIKLTDAEKAIVYDFPRSSAQTLITIYPAAFSASESAFDCGLGETRLEQLNDNKTDAFRHAYWNARMARDLSLEFAEKFATAHEAEVESLRAKMDLHNNRFGRELALRYPSASDSELRTLLSQAKYVFVREGEAFPDPAEALVFFSQREPLDATLVGTITNPDSGGPWQLSASFTQCGQVVRGTMTLVRDSSQQQRRFSGNVQEDILPLVIDNPFSFENPDNLNYCQNMTAALSGSGTSYSGPWSASNCPLGGQITLSQQ